MRTILAKASDLKAAITHAGGSPYQAVFYGDAITEGRRVRWEFHVIEDRAKLGDQELGRMITQTLDVMQGRNIIPSHALIEDGRDYNGFRALFTSAKWQRVRLVKRDFDRGYIRDDEKRLGRRYGV